MTASVVNCGVLRKQGFDRGVDVEVLAATRCRYQRDKWYRDEEVDGVEKKLEEPRRAREAYTLRI